ncbi:MAG TPA: hypothetical protein DCE71_07825 [Parachlamydiales bacterium]|nr:hypothetical protein [Parachlamydiales bacterium]
MITPDQLRALQFIVTYMQKARESSRARELLETEEGKFFVEIYKKLNNIPSESLNDDEIRIVGFGNEIRIF